MDPGHSLVLRLLARLGPFSSLMFSSGGINHPPFPL